MIRWEQVSVRYPGSGAPVLREIDLEVAEGELCLVIGRTGSGKSTLLGTVNGLVPHFTGGLLTGRVTVAGRDTRTHPPRELADVVGVVGQDPRLGFVTDVVEDELAYGMENLGVSPAVMRTRVEETLDLLGLADVRSRALERLSGGQRQRVAIGAALTAHPKVLVLDEPTSALDPQAAEDVLALLQRLVHDLGLTVLLAEHRLERVVQYADTVVVVPGPGGRGVVAGRPDAVLGAAPVAPPIVELGRLAGWSPLPLSVRDARRQAVGLRGRLSALPPAAAPARVGNPPDAQEAVAYVRGLVVRYGEHVALRGVDVTLHSGEVTALMGRNGAGKSTLLAALVGLRKAGAGDVRVGGADPGRLGARDLVRRVGLVPQDAADLLYADSVAAECGQADRDVHADAGSALALLERLSPGIDPLTHPGDLSEGQRLALALTVVMVGQPPVLLLDEPTRGLDYLAKRRLSATLRDLAARGHSVLLATHDVELVAEVADRVVVLGDGEVVADGPSADVVVASPVFAPQVAKVLAPLPFLTVTQVAQALAAG